jgi:hypothetical protein
LIFWHEIKKCIEIVMNVGGVIIVAVALVAEAATVTVSFRWLTSCTNCLEYMTKGEMMWRISMFVIAVIMLLYGACEKKVEGVVGVWEIDQVHHGDRLITDQSLPSLFIFTHDHYSMLWVLAAKPEQPFAKRWEPTDEEKLKRFNSLIVNSGTYEIAGDTLTMHPVVARVPDLVGGKQIGVYNTTNDTMRLHFVDEYSFDGVQAPWVAGGGLSLTLVRIE